MYSLPVSGSDNPKSRGGPNEQPTISLAADQRAWARFGQKWFPALVAERVTAVALVPLCPSFSASIIAHTGSDYAAFTAWIRTPLATGCMILLLIALFHHSALGLQVVIEDYVHSGIRFAAILAVRLSCYGLAVIGIIATLHIASGG